ncbi:hypothetical protein HYC85_032002 [Camellia sinensis]|uniref:Uncharacterized protein n=1 Tax=Camellia sinensis TaxID=4442 RepID=A0A7J7FS84_CAMSI|nr:hypothetical protein HYC85_032002 [Camellia sinensis]
MTPPYSVLYNVMTPPYSVLYNESEKGTWHVPLAGSKDESSRTWLCITRRGYREASERVPSTKDASEVGQLGNNHELLEPGESESISIDNNNLHGSSVSSHFYDNNKTISTRGKRKDRVVFFGGIRRFKREASKEFDTVRSR